MCAFYRPTIYKSSLYASPSEKELILQKKKSQQEDLRLSYVRQMEEAKQRKKLEKLLDKADDLIHLQTEKDYSPWGRGGGGAPLRDDMGDVISDLNAVYSGERSPVNEPLSPSRKNILQAAGAAVGGMDSLGNKNSSLMFSPVKATRQNSPQFKEYRKNELLDDLSYKLEQHHKNNADAFLDIDEDRSGYIDVNELANICKKYNLNIAQVQQVVRHCDIDRNGLISFAEFAKHLRYVENSGSNTIIAPRASKDKRYSPKSSNNLSPKGVLMKGMPIGMKAGEKRLILMDTPRSAEQRRRDRHRSRLKRDLDRQIALKKNLKEKEEQELLAEDLEWQQHLVEKGLDYWGRPIPEGDPRGTARLMAQNTVEKLQSSGLSPKEISQKASRRRRDRVESDDIEGEIEQKTDMPFMGSLHAMYANPEEEERKTRARNRLKNDLAEQVMENKAKKLEEEYSKKRAELESRQKKMDAGLDHWGQPIAAGDPYRIANRMKNEVKEMSSDLKEMKEKIRIEMGMEPSSHIVDNSNNYGNSRYNNNERNTREYVNDTNGKYDQNLDIGDELDKFMTPRDVREHMMMSNMPNLGRTAHNERQKIEHQQYKDSNHDKYDNKSDGLMLSNADTPSAMSEKSFVGLLSDKLYDMIKGAMWNEAYLRRLFQRFDLDNTGKITATNFRRAFSKLGLAATKSEINEMLKRLDPNRRGTINYLDFIKICVVNAKTKRANQLLREKREKKKQLRQIQPKGGRGGFAKYRNDQRIQTKGNRLRQRNSQIAWGERGNTGRTGRYRASSQYPAPTQSEIDAKKIEQLVSLTKRLLKEQTDLRASLARTNQALGVSV
jgi:Ca2+-binding EF-hand superfamily protein